MKLTPLRQQYLQIKKRYSDIIVFFRLGDFYETFDDDAKTVAKELEITLTSREMGKGNRIPLAGIPFHAIDNYLSRLINRGYKVAICEQLSPPGKGLVERDVVRIVTPGTIVEPNLLKDKNNNYLASIITDDDVAGISYVDITTGEFAATQLSYNEIYDEICRIQPSELILFQDIDFSSVCLSLTVTKVAKDLFNFHDAYERLKIHFKLSNLESIGCEQSTFAIRAAGAIIDYLSETQKMALGSIKNLIFYSTKVYMTIDPQTRRNLELFNNTRLGTISNSLLSVIDLTKTSMGGRLLRKWLSQPLLDLSILNYRHLCIENFFKGTFLRNKTFKLLETIGDLERLINRIKNNIAIPREVVTFGMTLKKIPELKKLLDENNVIDTLYLNLHDCSDIVALIDRAISDDPDAKLERGNVIKPGFFEELDNIKRVHSGAKEFLKNLEQNERQRTGIKSLKVLYNKLFGYYIEISKANLDLVPDNYIRKQTLVNSERFYTPEIKEYELAILNANEKIIELENKVFKQVCFQIAENINLILGIAQSIAEIDVITTFAEVASLYGYTKPELNTTDTISIKDGRHPVVEKTTGIDNFVPNDAYLDANETQIIILTGPNMSGKSTYLRQIALIVLMAQIGSYVPAKHASIGLIDRIFTRIGAQENIAGGESTFMVEMVETANILRNASPKSLVILDEVGRGTSTYDGMSIAWAVLEFMHNNPRLKSKTLFATHFHELVQLAESLPRVKNYNVAVSEDNDKVIFLHKIVPGGADKSYGINVAQLAGIPSSVINRANEVLQSLEASSDQIKNKSRASKSQQLTLFASDNSITEEILKLDVDSLTPLEAINSLYRLKTMARNIRPKTN